MAKNNRKRQTQIQSRPSSARKVWVILVVIGVLVAGGATALLMSKKPNEPRTPQPAATAPAATPAPPVAPPVTPPVTPPQPGKPGDAKMETMEVAKAVMVTQELDFGPKVPTIAEALKDIERRYTPDDGTGRTFAILDAYGEPTPTGKLHISMHVSSEKPGTGALVFKRTGQVLWQSRITPSSTPPKGKNLIIYIDNGKGTTQIVDGASNPSSILDARLRDLNIPIRDFWPDGEQREVTFIYSACGCPVKVMAKRQGDRTVRTTDLPVIFPDDPSAVTIISRLMRW